MEIFLLYLLGITIFILLNYFLNKKNKKNHQLVENIITKNLTIKERRNDVVGDVFITYYFSFNTVSFDFTFNRCHLVLLDDALVILGWVKTKLYTTKSKPMIITFAKEKYEKLFPMAYITGYKKANYYTNSNSVYFEIGDLEKSPRFSADMHLYRLEKEFREEIIKSLEKNDLAG